MSAWASLDKDAKALRKEEWLLIKENLALMSLTKTLIKALEAYFLRGKEHEDITLLFKLWLHIDDSLGSWQALRKETTARDFVQSCQLFNLHVISPSVRNETMKNYGFMGGKERRVHEFLFGGVDDEGLYHFDKAEPFSQVVTVQKEKVLLDFKSLSFIMNAWIRTDKPNMYSPVQYMAEQWYQSSLEVTDDKKFGNQVGARFVPNTILPLTYIRAKKDVSLVKKLRMDDAYLEIKETLEPCQQKTADALFEILENRELPAALRGHWDKLKEDAEKPASRGRGLP